MKLSVKWLAGLAVLALAIVAVVGASTTTKAAVGVIYVANTGQLTTTEPGRTLAINNEVTASNVWATYAADIGGGQALRLIDSPTDAEGNSTSGTAGADLVRVVIVDAGYDIATTETVDPTGAGSNLDLSAAFVVSAITIPNAVSFPVSGAVADIKIFLDDGAGGADGDLDGDETQLAGSGASPVQATVLAINAAGDTIQVRSEVAANATNDIIVQYQSSQVDTLQFGVDPDPGNTALPDDPKVSVRSDIGAGSAQNLFLTESGRSTGRFEGFVRITDSDGVTNWGLADVAATGSTATTAAVVRASSGPVVVSYVDSDGNSKSANILIDISAPVATVTGPTNDFATQNPQPTFSGTISESGSGLDISEVDLVIHEAADQTNAIAVLTNAGGNTGVLQSIVKTGAADGDFSLSFTHTPSAALPTSTPNPDHIVDFQVRAEDIAGNFGFSDSDGDSTKDEGEDGQGVTLGTVNGPPPATNPGAQNGAFDAHRVKIDRVAPSILSAASTPPVSNGDHLTGVIFDGATKTEVVDTKTLRVRFNDNVIGADTGDFAVTFPSVSAILTPISVLTEKKDVYLTLAQEIPADERPKVTIQGTIQDAAGNGSAFGSADVADGIKPTIGFSTSGGSGTGTGGEDSTKLTKEKMVITITSNEALSGPPTVTVFSDISATTPTQEATGLAQSSGPNAWTFNYSDTTPTGPRSVTVTGSDQANSGTGLLNLSANMGTSGKAADKVFDLDATAPAPVVTPADTDSTSQLRPFIVLDYSADTSSVAIEEILLDDVDVTSSLVSSADSKKFFIVPTTDLAKGDHTVEIPAGKAKDAAGNTSAAFNSTFEVKDRTTFDRDIFAGWNAVSFPSDPLDPDINSVFTNAGHDAVLGFDPSVAGQWRVSVRDTVSGLLEPATESGLTSVRSTQAYWVHSNNFEQVEVLLLGEVLPGAGSPPGIITIPTVLGFNAVPIVDTSRKLTTGGSQTLVRQIPTGGAGDTAVTVATYLGGVEEGRVYKWNPEILSFELLAGGDSLLTGEVLFVEVTGTPVPIFP